MRSRSLYYKGKSDLLGWVNKTLGLQITSLEEVCTLSMPKNGVAALVGVAPYALLHLLSRRVGAELVSLCYAVGDRSYFLLGFRLLLF